MIKFRFWDTEERNMYEVESVNGRGYKNKSGKDIFVISIEGELVKECPYELAEWRSFSDGVLMQSTGLKDKHGVEICEGDIVIERSSLMENYEPKKFDVVWDGWYCSFNLSNAFYYEVVGNKFEHPHLLKE